MAWSSGDDLDTVIRHCTSDDHGGAALVLRMICDGCLWGYLQSSIARCSAALRMH